MADVLHIKDNELFIKELIFKEKYSDKVGEEIIKLLSKYDININ